MKRSRHYRRRQGTAQWQFSAWRRPSFLIPVYSLEFCSLNAGGMLALPPTRKRSGFDNRDVVRDDAGSADGDVPSDSSSEDTSPEDEDNEQDRIVRSTPHSRTRLRL